MLHRTAFRASSMYKQFCVINANNISVLCMSGIAAYIRVSTEQQKEEDSHENQRERIQEWAGRQGYDGIDWYEDIAISGQADDRAAYQQLLEEYDQYEAVVVRELSRFGRDPLTVLQDVEEIAESDTQFVSITENFDTSSAMGKAFVRMVAVINGMYADLRREQAIKAAERRKEEGKPVGRPKKLDEELRREVFDLREKGVSYQAIARVIESNPNGPDSISRETIRRYCDEADVEPNARTEFRNRVQYCRACLGSPPFCGWLNPDSAREWVILVHGLSTREWSSYRGRT